mmetsp:Transcript_2482/g.3695  ORF Transcript_2482/g.3695 Transcript_2482/m.3695 type:complete len:347 (-) Transcript_2482:336-1376(-)
MSMPTMPYDKIELSPTGCARCRACKRLIDKDSTRIGIQTYQPNCNEWWAYYYHNDCAKKTTGLMENANFQPSSKRKSFQDDMAEERKKKRRMSESRDDLREVLRNTRNSLAEDLKEEIYMIFPNDALDSLVEHLPTTTNDLMQVPGFAWYRSTTYGPTFLPIIQKFKREMCELESKTATNRYHSVADVPIMDDKVWAASIKCKIEQRRLEPEFSSTFDSSSDNSKGAFETQVTRESSSLDKLLVKKSCVYDDALVSSSYYKMKPRRLMPEFGSTLDSADSNEGNLKMHGKNKCSFGSKLVVDEKVRVSSLTGLKTCRVSSRTRSKMRKVSSRTRSKMRRFSSRTRF